MIANGWKKKKNTPPSMIICNKGTYCNIQWYSFMSFNMLSLSRNIYINHHYIFRASSASYYLLFEIELIEIDLVEIELFQLDLSPNRPFGMSN